jgi:hypothetical protein
MISRRKVHLLLLSLLLAATLMAAVADAQPESESEGNKWVVWSNDVGWVHLGTMQQFLHPGPRSSETWGGNSTEPLKHSKLLGPFATEEEAAKALDAAVSEVEERYSALARPRNYLVAKIGGQELKLGSEIRLNRIPIIRFPPQYLIHITLTHTMNGPVAKDGYLMHPKPPENRKFQTADGYGGVFHNEGDLVGGPFTTNHELCPVLKGLGQKGIELCSPYGRWVSCDDPRWQEQGPPPAREGGTVTPDRETPPAEPEEPLEKLIAVRVELEDEDDQLTPADEALLHFEIKNNSRTNSLRSIKAEALIQGDFGPKGVIRFLNEEGNDRLVRSDARTLGPGESWRFDARIRIAGETNQWIFERLIQVDIGGRQDAQKPLPEKSVELKDALRMQISGRLAGGAEAGGAETEKKLFDGSLSLSKGREVQRISYPNLSKLAGLPGGSPDSIVYYQRGDLHFCHPGNRFIRAMALRAARYGGSQKAQLPGRSVFTEQLSSTGELDPNGPLLPENEVGQVAHNVVRFVHAALHPKNWPKTPLKDHLMAEEIWLGKYGTNKKAEQGFFICQEHSFLLGSLLRALGFCVREVNIITSPLWLKGAQDAASEVFYERNWHFFGLFKTDNYFTDHRSHYARWYKAYGMWEGVRSWTGENPRFNMNFWGMNTSEVWQFAGYGDDESFVASSSPPLLSWITPSGFYLAYEWFSPVAAMVVLPDGRRIGAANQIDPMAFGQSLLGSGDRPAGIVNEIPGAYYYPEGLILYGDASDAASAITMKQTIVVPAKDAAERNGHRLIVTGIGSGSYEIRATYVDNRGPAQTLGGVKGRITAGERVELSGSALQPQPIQAEELPAAGDKGKTKDKDVVSPPEEKGWRVEVEIDWVRDALVARVVGREQWLSLKVKRDDFLRQVASPKMLEFIRSVEIRDGVTFGKAMESVSGLAKKIEQALQKAQVAKVDHSKDGGLTATLRLPMRLLRAALPPGRFP